MNMLSTPSAFVAEECLQSHFIMLRPFGNFSIKPTI